MSAFDFRLSTFALVPLLRGPRFDAAFVRVEAHARAEGPAWVRMLLWMYERWAGRMGFAIEWVDGQPDLHSDDQADGLFRIAGPFAYGLLRTESGIHRLVRVMADGSGRRGTTFAAVDVLPDGNHPELPPSELMRQTFRSGGPTSQYS
jgi:peptide chain release factor 2